MGRGKKKAASRREYAAEKEARLAEEEGSDDSMGGSSVFSDGPLKEDAPAPSKKRRPKLDIEASSDDEDAHADTDEFVQYTELMSEKRVAVRKGAMTALIGMLNKKVNLGEIVEELADTICLRCMGLLKKGTAEAVLALRLIGTLFVRAGTLLEPIYPDIAKELIRNVKSHETSAVRAAALQTLSLCCFIGSTEDGDTALVMESLGGALGSGDKAVAAVALQGFALMHTVMGATLEMTATAIASTAPHLDDDATRMDAGILLAVLYEHVWSEGEGKAAVVRKATPEGLLEHVASLATLSSAAARHRTSKKDRKAQKAGMRDVMAALESGECTAAETLKLHKHPIEFSSWHDLARLYALRRVLLEGFEFHMKNTDLLREIFAESDLGVAIDTAATTTEVDGRMAAHEKRLFRSKNSARSKARTRNMARARTQRQDSTMNYAE